MAPIAPSAVRIDTRPKNWLAWLVEKIVFQTPREMTQGDIDHVTELFVNAAILASKAGFGGMEIHAR